MHHAFPDMLKLLNNHQTLATHDASVDEISSFKQRAAMFTVSSSNFRFVVLLHYPEHNGLNAQQLRHFRPELKSERRQYQDYVCELGNNFCGVLCRILGADDFSTGMSTPSLLNISNSARHLQRIKPFCEAHMASVSEGTPLLCASVSLFFNSKAATDLCVNVPSAAVEDDSLGELEFF